MKKRITDMRELIFENSIPEPNSGCWFWDGSEVDKYGYGRIMIHKKRIRVHRLSYEAFKEAVPSELSVCHRCDTPCCVNPDHLFVGTTADNMKDKVNKGRQARGDTHGHRKKPEAYQTKGEGNGRAVLSEKDVNDIRAIIAKGGNVKKISKDYRVHQNTIYNIRSNKSWR